VFAEVHEDAVGRQAVEPGGEGRLAAERAGGAEEVDVFVHLFRTAGSFRGEAAFTTWLHRLTANRVLMHFRKQKSRREETTEDGSLPERAAEPSAVSPGRTQLLDRLALDRALARLPHGYRTVFVLHDIEGYEHEEIGRIVGIAAGTSKSQLHKARARLRKLLKDSKQ